MAMIQSYGTMEDELSLGGPEMGRDGLPAGPVPEPRAAGGGAGAASAAVAVPSDGDEIIEGRGPRVFTRLLMMTAPLVVSDLLALALSAIAGVIVLHVVHLGPAGRLGWTMPLVLLPLVLAYWPWGLYPASGVHPVVELRELTKLNTIAFIATLLACIVTRSSLEWQVFFTVAWVVSLALVPFLRAMTRPSCAGHWWWGHPVLVISSGNTARKVVKMMQKTPHLSLRPCGVVDAAVERRGTIQGVPLVSRPAAINALIRTHSIRHGVIALPDLSPAQVMEVIDRYRSQIPFLLVLSSSSDMPLLWGSSRDVGGVGGLSGIEVRNGLMLATPRVMKRLMDVMLTTIALVVGLPVLAVVALAVRLTSRGPILYGQKRPGFGGATFRVWKFRTMHVESDLLLRRYLDAHPEARVEWERDYKLKDDPRITRIGRFLRKSSLDELPQLWNVLQGEMSLVGPRPILNEEVEKYGKVFKLYKDVKPGITGLWQVSGRNDTTYEERVQFVNYYVRNWSPWLDIHILARTVGVLVRGSGAY